MKLFVSYRRKSWPFTRQLVNDLRKRIDAEIFVDYQSVDETNFEQAILRHLRESDAVLLIVSEYTFAARRIHRDDDWVRREIREALKLDKRVVIVFVDGQQIPIDIPQDIRDIRQMEGVNFYPEYFEACVNRLTDFIFRATPLQPARLEDPDSDTEELVPFGRAALQDAINALDEEDYDTAIRLLEGLIDSGYKFPFISLDGLLADARRARDQARRWEEAFEAYSDIAVLARSKNARERAREAWIAFLDEYPDFEDDLDNLAEKLDYPLPAVSAALEQTLTDPLGWIAEIASPVPISLPDETPTQPHPGETGVAGDDQPTQIDLFRWLAELAAPPDDPKAAR